MPGIRIQPPRNRWRVLGPMLLAGLVVVLVGWWLGQDEPVAKPIARSAPDLTSVALPVAAVRAADATSMVARPAAVVPSAQAAVSSPLNFDSVDNMYALAVRAADSSDPMVVYNGFMAIYACRMHTRPELEALVAKGGADAATRERVRAAGLVLRRCAGVFDNDNSANMDLLRRLAAKVRAAPGYYLTTQVQGERVITAQDFVDVVNRGDWHTLSVLIQQSQLRVSAPDAAASASDETLLVRFVGRDLAVCDLGRNCGPDGFDYAAFCVHGNSCDGSFEAFFRIGFTPQQWAAIQAQRAEVVAAVRRRDTAYFGFPR